MESKVSDCTATGEVYNGLLIVIKLKCVIGRIESINILAKPITKVPQHLHPHI